MLASLGLRPQCLDLGAQFSEFQRLHFHSLRAVRDACPPCTRRIFCEDSRRNHLGDKLTELVRGCFDSRTCLCTLVFIVTIRSPVENDLLFGQLVGGVLGSQSHSFLKGFRGSRENASHVYIVNRDVGIAFRQDIFLFVVQTDSETGDQNASSVLTGQFRPHLNILDWLACRINHLRIAVGIVDVPECQLADTDVYEVFRCLATGARLNANLLNCHELPALTVRLDWRKKIVS